MAPSLTASSGSENAAARPPFSPQILNGLSLKELHLAGVAQSSTKVVTPIKLRLCKGKSKGSSLKIPPKESLENKHLLIMSGLHC